MEDHREELVRIWKDLMESVLDTLESDHVLPKSITHNSDKVGIMVEFNKLSES